MENLVKNFRNIENSIARYIYKKYIMPEPNTEDIDIEDGNILSRNIEVEDEDEECVDEREECVDEGEECVDEGEECADEGEDYAVDVENINTPQVNKNVLLDKTLYKIYLQTIFDLERKTGRILQDDVLKEDLKKMNIADKAYNINPANFNPKEYESLPDILRCTFIRKNKHRYYRCCNKVINDDSDICKKHENSENIYLDKYNELLDSNVGTH